MSNPNTIEKEHIQKLSTILENRTVDIAKTLVELKGILEESKKGLVVLSEYIKTSYLSLIDKYGSPQINYMKNENKDNKLQQLITETVEEALSETSLLKEIDFKQQLSKVNSTIDSHIKRIEDNMDVDGNSYRALVGYDEQLRNSLSAKNLNPTEKQELEHVLEPIFGKLHRIIGGGQAGEKHYVSENIKPETVVKIQNLVAKHGTRDAAYKIISNIVARSLGLGLDDLPDTQTVSDSMDDVEVHLESKDYSKAWQAAKDGAIDIIEELRDEMGDINPDTALEEIIKECVDEVLNETKFQDPTHDEMMQHLIGIYGSEIRDDAEIAIYYFAEHNHDGQGSNLYSVLSTSPYKPGPMSTVEKEGEMVMDLYRELTSKFGSSRYDAEHGSHDDIDFKDDDDDEGGLLGVTECGTWEQFKNHPNVVNEVTPPGMEDFVKAIKPKMIAKYGDRGSKVAYATAWKKYNSRKK